MLDIMKVLKRPNVVPCSCGHTGCGCGITEPGWFGADSDLGTHNLRFMLHEPAWPVRLDMDGSWVPMGVKPASPDELPNGFLPAESDDTAEDMVYSMQAADELVTGLGLESAQPWLDRGAGSARSGTGNLGAGVQLAYAGAIRGRGGA